jgi:TBC1 domain family protein 5
VYWRVCHISLDLNTPLNLQFYHGLLPTPTSLDLFPPALETSRAAYTSLRRRYLVAPDGRWAADCSGAEEQADTGPSSPRPDGDGWDPLSLDGQSPWKTWFAHQELRATIRQDVERTFPDIPYFELERVRTALVTVLFLFSVLNPDVGYRQVSHKLWVNAD